MTAPVIIIGGEPHELPRTSFRMVRKLGPVLDAMRQVSTNIDLRSVMLDALAILLPVDREALEDRITYAETSALMEQWADLLRWTGLVVADPGEAPAASSSPSASTI